MRVELIYDPDCPNVDATRQELSKVLGQAGFGKEWVEWDRQDPNSPSYVRRYGSPTILVDGEDVAPQNTEEEEMSCCRVYKDGDGHLQGVPSAEALRRALGKQRMKGSGGDEKARRAASFGVIPALGAGLLPVGACPACWPAYAGVLGSLGLGVLLNAAYLFPLTAILLGFALVALGYRAKERQGYGPMGLGALAAAMVLVGKFGLALTPVTYIGVGLLLTACLWNAWPWSRSKTPENCPSCDQKA